MHPIEQEVSTVIRTSWSSVSSFKHVRVLDLTNFSCESIRSKRPLLTGKVNNSSTTAKTFAHLTQLNSFHHITL